jgi:hypothetical protein
MPFKSTAQQRFMFANPGKLGGLKKVKEWAHETDFSRLPERAPTQKGKPRIHVPPPHRRKK